MRKTTIVLQVLVLATVMAIAAPAMAQEQQETANIERPCVKVFIDEPGVYADPWCLVGDHLPPVGDPGDG